MKAILKRAQLSEVFQISPGDTNYFVILFDPTDGATGSIFLIEIFRAGGATPPNTHAIAQEFFYVLHGEGIARCGGEAIPVAKGDAILVQPETEHIVENTGAGKLYTLTVMHPNEGFSELIRRGQRIELDDEDRRVLEGVL